MSEARLKHYVQTLCKLPGTRAAALVDRGSGMVWAQAGVLPEIERLSETAIEFWRLHERTRSNLDSLGTPESIAITCSELTLSLRPAPESLANSDLIIVLVLDWHMKAS
jgi:hypothetical protein